MPKTRYRSVHRDGYGAKHFATMTEAALFVIAQDDQSNWRVELMTVSDCVPDAHALAEFDLREMVGCNL